MLRDRGNDVLVIVTPFNEHMIADQSLAGYPAIRSGVAAWLSEKCVPYVAPDKLPSELYADASHPLTAGYELLARHLYQTETFRKWTQDKRRNTAYRPTCITCCDALPVQGICQHPTQERFP